MSADRCLLAVGLALCGWPLLGAGWTLDSPLQVPAREPRAMQVQALSWDGQGGYLMTLDLGDGSREVLHLDAAEELISRRRAEGDGDPDRSVYPLAGTGGLRADGQRQSGCLNRMGADGLIQWSSLDSTSGLFCGISMATPSGATWVIEGSSLGNTVARIDPAGRWVLGREQLGSLNPSPSALAATGDEGVYVAGYRPNGATVARLAADGGTLWRTELSLDQTGLDCRDFALQARETGVRATCLPWAPGTSEYWDLSADGALLASARLNHPFGGHDFDQPTRLDRHPEVLAASGSVTRFDSERNLLWTYQLPPAADGGSRSPKAFLVDANGELRLIAGSFDFSLQRDLYDFYALRPDGTLRLQQALATGPETTGFHPLPNGEFMLGNDPRRRVDSDGQLVDVALGWLEAFQVGIDPVAAFSGADDRILVSKDGASLELQAYHADGRLKWAQPLPGADSSLNKLAVNAAGVCWRSAQRLEDGYPLACFDRDDGTPLISLLLDDESLQERRWSLLGDDILALVQGMQLRFVSIRDGSEVRTPEALQHEGQRLIGEHGNDRLVVVGGSRDWALWLDQPMTERRELEPRRSQHLLLPDGLFSTLSSQVPLRWESRSGEAAVDFATELAFERFLVHRDGDRVILLQYDDARAWLLALNLSSGSVLWRQDLPWRLDGSRVNVDRSLAGGPLADPGQGYAALATANDLELISFQIATGQLLGRRALPCHSLLCRFWLAGESDTADSIPLLVERRYEAATRRVASLALDRDQAIPTSIAANQLAVSGAWYNPAHRGQGFVLSYIPDSQTLFMPWFTYRQRFGPDLNDESNLRWYSLQGQIGADVGRVRMQLLRNEGGVFAQPPTTAAVVVGNAELSFDSCLQGTLTYQFDTGVENGQGGSLPLQRLGPQTRPCQLPDGSLAPAQIGTLSAEGFSIEQSGAWFDPASSGQGLMVEVVPADGSQAGLLFATWFTYDLADGQDDTGTQDWFVLQGTLRDARDGRVTVPIYRSLGGLLDHRGTPHLFRVGEAELSFDGCESLRLRHRFDDNELARRHRALEGEQQLLRIGGCGGQ